MHEFILPLLGWNAALAALLALVLLLFGFLGAFQRRPALRHALWLLVLVKIITPPLIPLPVLEARSPSPAEASVPPTAWVPPAASPAAPLMAERTTSDQPPAGNAAARQNALVESPAPPRPLTADSKTGMHRERAEVVASARPPVNRPWTIVLLAGVWCGVTLLLLIRGVRRAKRLSRLLQSAAEADERLRRVAGVAADRMQVSHVQLRVVDGALPPLIWIGRSGPVIVFPQTLVQQLCDEQLVCIACHELAHYRRRDHWSNGFAMFVTACCWWHPAAWVACRELRKSQELCCDELVIQQGKLPRRTYLQALFRSLEYLQGASPALPSFASSFGDSRSLRIRFQALAGGRLVHRNRRWTRLALVALFGLLLCIPIARRAVGERTTDGARPGQLYLHWYKPGHLGGDTPPRHLLTIEITAGKDFFFRERGHWIQGRLDANEATFSGDVRTFWISRERFRGDFPLDEPRDATVFEWSKGYYPTRVALSRERSPKTILAREAERYKAATAADDHDVRDSAANTLTFAAVDLKRYADHYASSVGASLCNTTYQVYDVPVSDEVNRRNFALCRQAVQKIVANLETRVVDWSLNRPDGENKRKIYVGKPIKTRLTLDLPENKSWDEAIEIKLFLEGPPQKNNLMYRDTYPPAKSHLFMEFMIGDLQGGRLGPISGGAMVRSAVYSHAGPPALSEDQERELTLTFQSGYDPRKPPRDGVGVLPDDAWGDAVRGLQAALHIPEKVCHSEVAEPLLVVRNTSDKTIRVTWPKYPQVRIRRPRSVISYGMGHDRSFVERWQLKPGQQINVRMKPVQFLKRGDFGLNAGLKIPPGPQAWSVRIDNRGEHWVWGPQGPDGPSVPFVVPEGEWVGALKAPDRQVELLEEKAEFRVTPPTELPADHGLSYVHEPPPTVDWSRAESVPLRQGLALKLNSAADAHWLHDFGRYTKSLYWGPISGDRLLELGLLPLVAESSKRLLKEAIHESQTHGRIASLVRRSRPLARLGLRLVPLLEERKSPGRFPSDELVRTIRDRRVELLAMGLERELEVAVQQLTAHDPPLPPEASFQVIADKSLPKELKPDAWGPVNNGLRSAALMPAEIVDGQTANVRLFIRNVSDQEVWMTVSDRPGYDYATATDVRGLPLKSARPLVYPQGFAGGIAPEYNPGQMTTFPPLATLTKLVLRAGAVYELKTRTGLRFDSSGKPVVGAFALGPKKADETAVTVISSKPAQAMVTWRLHTANGAIHDRQLTKRLWPARGGWSGLLTTAPTRVVLKAAE